MSPKTDKLTQRIQDLQQFVTSRISQDTTYGDIAEKLEQISTVLSQGKLNLQIWGRSRSVTESLENLLTDRNSLESFYRIQTTLISDVTSTKSPSPTAVLVAQTNVSQLSPYSLPCDRKTTVGRRPGNDIIVPNDCTLVSGQHLEIIPPTTPDGDWIIVDLNSTNGIFINGQAVRGSEQVLRSQDRIVLGEKECSDRAPEFVFECESNPDLEASPVETAIADADVLCWVFKPSQPFSEEEKGLIEQASQSEFSKIAIVADMPSESQRNSEITDNLEKIEGWLKNERSQLVCLSLQSSYSQETDADVLAVDKQEGLSNFYQQLEKFGQNQLEKILVRRSTQGAIAQVARIEEICDRQQAQLLQEIEATEAKLQVSGTRDLKEQLRKEIKNANQEKDALFKEIKYELSEFKNNLLSEKFKVGLPYKIEQFVEVLSHIITKTSQQTHIYVCLPDDNQTKLGKGKNPQHLSSKVHQEMTRFCQEYLNYSAAHKWQKICNQYGNGGLNQLFQKNCARFNALVSTLNLSSTDYQPPQAIDINKIFLHSSVEYTWTYHYKTVPMISYLFKNIKGQIMSVVMLISLLSGGAGFLKDQKLLIIWILCPIVLILLIYSYQRDKEEELKKNIDTLQLNGCKEYQSIGKELVNRMMQLIGLVLDSEEQKFKQILSIAEEQSTDYSITLKNTLMKLKAQEMELKKERLELEKRKRF